MNKKFTDEAWDDYQYWIENDKNILKRINRLIKDIDRNPYEGIGKPEPLKLAACDMVKYFLLVFK